MCSNRLGAFMGVMVLGLMLGGGVGTAWTHEGSEHGGAKNQAESVATLNQKEICPVSGEEIDKAGQFPYAHEGKIYDFCCTDCLEIFKKDPQKYVEKVIAGGTKATAGPKHRDGHDHD